MTQLPEGFEKVEKNPQTEPPTLFKELPEGFEKVSKITELPEDFVKEDDLSVDDIKKMQSEGVPLSEKLQRKLFKADDERSFLDKVSGAAGAFIPAAADIIGQTASGAVELANKAVVQPAALALTGGYGRLDSEEAKKVFKEREEAIRSLGVGVAKDIEETVNTAVRFGMFGSATTDKLLGKSDEERFRAWQNRQTMRELEAQELEQNPDRVAALLSQNPLIQGYVEYEAKKMGLSPEEVEKVKQDYIQTMLDQGLTKDQINQNISALGEFVSPVAIPGGGRLSEAALKPLSKVTAPVFNKATDLTARGISKVAGVTEFAANKVLQGTELLQTGARKIGEYAINDPDTWIKGTVNTAILPVVGVAKPVSATARVIKDITKQVDVGGTAGRMGMIERAGQAVDSSDLTKKLFGSQGKGGVARAKVADWTIRQSNALIQPGINAAAMNVVMGLPDIETAEDIGFVSGTGFGIGGLAGTRSFERVSGLVDPKTTMAEKITNFVTPDPAAYRRDEDADIKRFMAQANPEIQQNIADLSNIESRKAAIETSIANLEKERDAQINPDDVAFKQKQIDGFLKQKEALSKATPETQAEATRQTALAFIDAYDLAQSTGGVAGLRGVNIAVLDPANADQFFRDLYGDSLKQAETTINLLTGIPSLTETDSQKLTEARQLLQKFQNDVEGAKSARGFALQEDNTDPNSAGFVPPHLRRINQQGATAVVNADLIKHMTSQGLNLRHTLQHEVQHAVQQFAEVNKMLAPIRGQLFDQKIKNDDGTTEVYQQGIYSDEDLDRYATQYAKMMSPSDNGASFYAQFGGEVEKMRAYIKDEILAETAAATGEYAGGTRASLDDVGRNVMDWIEVKTKSGRLKQLKETLRKNGIIFDNTGEYSAVLGAQMSPETLSMVRQYQRGLKDFDGTMTVQQSRESDEPDIPLTKVLGSVALQNKYRHADFFEKEQIIKATAPDGSVTEIVVPAGAKIDPFVDVYRTQGGQLVDADGNVVTLGPEITFGSMPDGTTFETDTRIARKSNGSPIILTNREMKARARKRTEIIQTAIDSTKDDGSGVRLSDTGNGNYRGVMSPAQIAAFMALPNEVVSPNLKRMTKFFNELMAKNDGTRVVMEYQAALLNGKYKALSPKIRDEVPIGFQLTKDGNFALTTISVSRLSDKMQAWADKKPSNLQPWGGDTGKFWDSVVKYLDNHAKGEKGETGLNPDAYIAGKMKNKINDLFNAYNAETKQANPDRSTLPRARGKDNLDIVIRSRRLDRINNFEESPSQKLPINYGYLTTNYMPAVNPMAAPMTAEEVQNRFDGSVTATRVRQAMATGEIDALESELRQMDDLLPTESLQLVQGQDQMPRIQIVSMFDPENVASLEPEEIVSDIDAETEAELAILDAQDGTVPPQDIAKVLSAKLDQLYADGGRSPIIPALETELEKIYQQLESQAQEQAAATIQTEEATQAPEEIVPVTQFMPAVAEAPSGERGFKSKLQTEIQRKFQGATATPEQLKAVITNPQNVKQEEVKWSGILDAIDRIAGENNGKVPVAQLMDYLRNEGQIKFEEVILGKDKSVEDIADTYKIKIEDQYGEAAFYDEFDEPLEFDELPFALQNAIDKSSKLPTPKFANYQLPGGENYREVVMAMPKAKEFLTKSELDEYQKLRFETENRTPEQQARLDQLLIWISENNAASRDDKSYTSSHFPDIQNYVAHMRLNERTDAEGNDGLFIEELQSDRHQAGREQGYNEDLDVARREELRNKAGNLTEAEMQELGELNSKALGRGIPDAPFRKDWSLQLFKRALRDAVDSEKEWIGWTTGNTQAERYDLSKQIGKVVWNEDTRMLTAYDPSQKRAVIQESNITSDKLADYVGKEVAQKLVEQSPDEDMDRQISGLDLKVGGEGMKGFYDQILPKEIGKYVAKMGGKVEKSDIATTKPDKEIDNFTDAELLQELARKGDTTPIWRVNITPEMANVVSAGQLQFMPAGEGLPLSDAAIPDAIAKGGGEFAILRQALQGVEAPVREPAKTPEVPKQEIPVAKTEDTEEEVADTELVSTGIDVPEYVDEQSVISNAIKIANSQPWKKGRDFKLDIQGKVRAAAERAGVTISDRTAESIEYLARVGLKDGLIALEQNPNAIGWYDEKTKQALGVMSLLFPEIAKDENARFAFTWALAVTSNGLKVDKNFELAERVYREYRKTGKMPNNIQAGQAQKAINKSLDLFNQLTKEWGIDNTRKFMQTDFTVGEISRLGVVSKADKKEVKPGGEFADTTVRGSAILGPKIGNGFFSNLYGLFDALTMDRWLVRTWGRWTGTLVELNPELTQISKTRLEETLAKLTPEDKARMDEMIGKDISQMSTEDLSVAIQKASMKPELRDVMNTTTTGEEFRKAGNSLAKYLDGQKEAPANPAERNFIREIFGLMLDELKANPKYKDLTMADLQAVLWYAEKRLYETAKVKADQDDVDSSDADGYEDDEAPDYANAAIGVARKQGVSENRINKVLQKIKNDRTTTTRLADEGRGDIETEQQESAGGFAGKEKQKFRQYVAVTTARRNRTGNEKALWSYSRKSGSDSGDAGVLKPRSKKTLGVKYISEWKAGRKLATMFRNNGLPPVKFLELDSTDKPSAQKFADTLQKSKDASVNGAAVYVYPVEDYQGMKLFISESGKSGFALKPDGDIVSVFSMDKGSGRSIMETAISAGGKKLDAFDTILPEFYGTHGFVEAARIPWNDEYAPEGWDKETFKDFNNGEPDVVMMVLDPKFEGDYSPRTDIYATDYDQAVAMQSSLLKKIEKRNKKK